MRLQSKISLESRTFELFRLVKRYTSSVDTFTALSGRRQKKRPELKLAVYLNDPCQGALAIQEREREERKILDLDWFGLDTSHLSLADNFFIVHYSTFV